MIALLAADLRRIAWRPMTLAMGLVTVVFAAAVGVIVFVHTDKVTQRFDRVSGLTNAVSTATGPVVLAAFVFGASLLGADYSSRALSTLLTWQPRRSWVLGSRSLATAGFVALAALGAMAVVVLAMLPAYLAHGTGPGAPWLSVIGLSIRSALLAAVASASGVAAAAIGRGTTAAVIAAGVYFAAIEPAFINALPNVGRWLLSNAALSWEAALPKSGQAPGGSGHTVLTGGAILLVAVLLLQAVATLVFTRRDVL